MKSLVSSEQPVKNRSILKKIAPERLLTLGTLTTVLFVWFAITSTGAFSETIIPSPASVWESFVEVTQNGYKGHTLLQHLATSMQRLVIAYLLVAVSIVLCK